MAFLEARCSSFWVACWAPAVARVFTIPRVLQSFMGLEMAFLGSPVLLLQGRLLGRLLGRS